MTCALLIAIPAIAAIADQLRIDGDVLNTSNSANTTFTLCPNVGGSVDQKATINYQGSDHFRDLTTVTITASVQSTAQNFITATGATVVTGTSSNAWNNNSDSVSTGNLPLTVDTDWAAGTYDVTYTATGQKAGTTAGTNLTLTDTSKITIEEATSGCQAPNEAPVVNVVGPEDNAQYEINDVPAASCSVTDEDANASATPQFNNSGLNSYGLGSVTVTCSYTDSSQETGTDTVTYTIVDTGDPLITHVSDSPASPNGSNQWYTSAVSSTFQAEDFNGSTPADAGAGFLSPLTNPHNFDVGSGTAEGDNVSNNSGTVEDVAGNVSNNASSGPFKIDLSDPTNVQFSGGPDAGSSHFFGSVPAAPTCTAEDAVSGMPAGGGCVVTGYSTAVGSHTMTATATDNAGRTATATRSYTVKPYTLNGFYQPIDMNDTVNTVKNGSTVPVKFELFAGSELTSTSAVTSIKSTPISCASLSGDPEDAIETVATGGTSLRYDTTAGQFIYNWTTPKGATQVGKCYSLTMSAADNSSTLTAYFKLK